MKTLLYYTVIFATLFTSACRSVDKLVDQGRYDEAIVLATKKLAGQKKKKTKHIKALEEAFFKVNRYDNDHISDLRARAEQGDERLWESIYDYALKIQARQNRVTPFLPLISKDRYVGSFDLIDIVPVLDEVGPKAAEHLYALGGRQLERAVELDDKLLAQEAHNTLQKIGRYFSEYKNTFDLLNRSEAAGTFHILIKMQDTWAAPSFNNFFSSGRIADLQKRWTRYHADFVDGIAFDAISTISMDGIDISPEREVVNTFSENKELERWVDEVDQNGAIITDSLGNAIRYREVEIVRATITEVIRSKEAVITARVTTTDFNNGAIIDNDRFTHEVNFASDACNLEGDRRALSDDFRKRLDLTLSPFPTDFAMIDEASRELNDDIYRHIDRLDYSGYYRNQIAFR